MFINSSASIAGQTVPRNIASVAKEEIIIEEEEEDDDEEDDDVLISNM